MELELDSSLEVADQSVTLDSLLEADDEADYEESEPESAELTEEEWFAAVAEDAEEEEDKLPLALLDTLLANVLGEKEVDVSKYSIIDGEDPEEEEEEEEGSEAEEKDVETQAPVDEKKVEINGSWNSEIEKHVEETIESVIEMHKEEEAEKSIVEVNKLDASVQTDFDSDEDEDEVDEEKEKSMEEIMSKSMEEVDWGKVKDSSDEENEKLDMSSIAEMEEGTSGGKEETKEAQGEVVACFLCQEPCSSTDDLRKHLEKEHEVEEEQLLEYVRLSVKENEESVQENLKMEEEHEEATEEDSELEAKRPIPNLQK